MSPPERPWFRTYSEMTRDRKLRRLKPEHRWLWVTVLCMAGTSEPRGALFVGSSPAQVEDIADEAALPPAKVRAGLAELEASGMIEKNGSGAWHVVNWSERQYEPAPSSTRRVQLFRDPELRAAIRERDGDLCRYCGLEVVWKDRRGPNGGTYDHIEPRGETDLANLVVSCRSCNARKGNRNPDQAGMVLLPSRSRSDLGRDLDRSRVVPTPPESESDTELCSSLSHSEPSCGQAGDDDGRSDEEQPLDPVAVKRRAVLERVVDVRTQGIAPPNAPGPYRAKVLAQKIEQHGADLDRLLELYPDAPVESLAGQLLGEPNSLHLFRKAEAS